MAFRVPIAHQIRRSSGVVAKDAYALVRLRGTGTNVKVYSVGTTTPGEIDPPITRRLYPDSNGWVRGYVPVGSRYDIFVTDGTNSYTQPWEPFAAAMEPWTYPTLLNGHTDYGSGFAPARYTKTSEGLVVLSGVLGGGAAVTAFNLPAGYRPASTVLAAAWCVYGGANIIARVDIQTNGNVDRTSGATIHGFDGIEFLAEA